MFSRKKRGKCSIVHTTASTRKKAIQQALIGNARRTGCVMISRWLGRPPRYLPVLLMFLTNRCNLRCKMCGVYQSGQDCIGNELTTEQWKSVLDSAADNLKTTLISISGGEPLLRPDLFDIIRHAADKGMAVHVCTNATLLSQAHVEKFRNAGLTAVSLSIESPDAAEHDYLRGEGTHAAAVSAIQRLRETAPEIRIGINYLITRRNFRSMADMVAFAETEGVHQIKFAPIHTNLLHRRKDIAGYQDLLFAESDLPGLEAEVLRVQRACRNSALLTTSPDFFAGIADLYRKPRKYRCYAGYALCAIAPNGDVAPCCDMDSPFNVQHRSLDQIWRDPAFHSLRKQVHACASACWDTTNTELSLKLRPGSLLRHIPQALRDFKFYFAKHNR